ncbi:MAG: InlB B-repeat-containing protein [Clostridiales bacterium]|nr:InlB B-repeat-containing protein [Clostridiales bacterium]
MRRGMITRFMVIFIALALVAFVPFKAKADDELQPESTIDIISQPVDYMGPVGETATFTVEAEGSSLTYQWQVLKSSGWTNCSNKDGAKTDTLTLAITSNRNNTKYHCIISDANETSVITEEATLTVGNRPKDLTIISQPTDYYGPVGETAKFTVEADGDGLTYQWQVLKSSGWSNCSKNDGAKTATLSLAITSARDNTTYKCIITDERTNTVTTDEVTLHVGELAEILTQPVDYSGPVGGTATFTVEAKGSGIKYQWQVRKSSGWTACSMNDGAKTATLSIGITQARDGLAYRCIVTDKFGFSDMSEEVVLHVAEVYSVTFDAGEGIFPSNNQATTTDTYEPGSMILSEFEVPVREGYKFLGWKNASGTYVNYVELTENVTFTAGWVKTYTVTYHANGGSFGDSDTYIETDINKGNYYIQYGIEPHRPGYVFVGWIYNNKPVNSMNRIRITSNADVYADWAPAATVTYLANGGKWQYGDNEPVTTEIRDELKGVTYYIGSDVEEPFREGYKFIGWKINDEWAECVVLNSNITIEAQWEGCVNVTFDANQGAWYGWEPDEFEGHPTQETTRVEQWEIMESWINMDWPERECYDFIGWSTDPDATEAEPQFFYDLTEDVVFYAIWRAKGVIHYNAGDGEFRFYEGPDTYKTEQVVDDYVSGPDFYYVEYFMRPERDGYEFNGWVDGKNEPVTGDIIVDNDTDLYLYATWLKRVTITYDANGGGWNVHVRQDGQEWDEYRETEYDSGMEGDYYRFNDWRPSLEDYEFTGWMFEDETLVEDKDYLLTDKDITVYAVWTKLKKVTYDANGGYYNYVDYNSEDYENSFIRYYRADEEFHLDGRRPEINEDDRYFIGWTTEQDNIATLVDDSLDLSNVDEITLYAYWYTPATITYHGNGGVWHDWDEENQEEIEIDTIVRSAWDDGRYRIEGWRPDYTQRGEYELLGYAIDDTSNEVTYYCDEELDLVAEDMDLYAVWAAYPKLIFNAGEGCFWDGRTVETRYFGNGQKVFVRCEAPERLGYDFIGWAYADDPDCTIVDESILELYFNDEYEFVAIWEKRPTVIVCYDPNGGSFGEPEGKDFRGWDQDPDENFAVGCAWPWRFGYEFVGWSLDPEATEAEKDWIYDLEEDTVFYAIWKRNVLVTLDAAGGNFEVWVDGYWDEEQDEWIEGHDEYVGYDYFSVKENSIIPVRHIGFSVGREGYSFDGWTDAEGNYVNLVEVGTEDITLYASWIKEYQVTFDYNDGIDYGEDYEPMIYYYNEGDVIETVYLEEPYRDGYMFVGWTVDDQYVTYVDVDRDMTFVAQWIEVDEF